MREAGYQAALIRKLRERFPGCIILKNDPEFIQGIPDLTILFEQTWGTLEVKVSSNARLQPNQQYYVDLMDSMSFSAVICPENEEEVLRALQQTFASRRDPARIP